MCITICRKFCPDRGVTAGYADQIQAKYTAKQGVQIVEMIFSNMLQASPLIVYKYMLNVNIRVDLSEKLCYPYYWLLFTPFTVTRFAMHRNHAKHDFAPQFSGFL